MRKKITLMLLCVLFITSLVFTACASTSVLELNFTSKAVADVKLGDMVTVEDVTATDKADSSRTFRAQASVKNKNNESVTLQSNKFKAEIIGDAAYIITYQVVVDEVEFKTETRVNVKDQTPPVISIGNTDILLLKGVEFDLSELDAGAIDNSGETVTLQYSASIGTVAQIMNGSKFTPGQVGDCTIYIDAEDSFKNKAVQVEVSAKVIEVDSQKEMIQFNNLAPADVVNGGIVQNATFGSAVKVDVEGGEIKRVTISGNGNFEIYKTANVIIYMSDSAELKMGTNTGLAPVELVAGWNIVAIENLTAWIDDIEDIQDVVFNITSTKAVTATICALVADEKAALSEFHVPEIATAAIGEDYTVVDTYALFTNGFKVKSTVVVTLNDKIITVTNSVFKPTESGVYIITYTVNSAYLESSLVKKMEVTVSDT